MLNDAMLRTVSEVAISAAVLSVAVLSYAPLAERHCAGLGPQTLPWTKLLSGYPCTATTGARAGYLLFNGLAVLRDITYIDASDKWLTFGTLAVVMRFLATLVLPPDTYKVSC